MGKKPFIDKPHLKGRTELVRGKLANGTALSFIIDRRRAAERLVMGIISMDMLQGKNFCLPACFRIQVTRAGPTFGSKWPPRGALSPTLGPAPPQVSWSLCDANVSAQKGL